MASELDTPEPCRSNLEGRSNVERRINVGAVAYLNARPLTLCLEKLVPAEQVDISELSEMVAPTKPSTPTK